MTYDGALSAHDSVIPTTRAERRRAIERSSSRGFSEIVRATTVSSLVAPLVMIAALVIWFVSLPALNNAKAGGYGLLAANGGAGLIASVCLTLFAFLFAISRNQLWIGTIGIALVILFERVTVTILTDVPIYAWTYKHIGVVDYIQKKGSLAPASVDIYNQWPGFFTLAAWIGTATGLDPVDLAHWFAPVVHILIAVLVGALAHALGSTTKVALVAAMLAEILNWVGQDYFSPQAAGIVLALGILVLLAHSRRHPITGYLTIPIFAALVCTHQLTPYWIFGVTFALVVLRKIKPFWLPVIYGIILGAYLIPRLGSVEKYGLLSGGNPVSNASPNITSRGADGRVFTVLIDRSISVTMWSLAIVAFLILLKRGASPWIAGVIAFSSIGLLAAQSYGGEAIFRVYLYSIAGCAVLIAPFIVAALESRHRWRLPAQAAVIAVFLALGLAGLQGYYGGWSHVTIERAQLDQSRMLLAANTGAASIIPVGPAGWPERASADYVRLAQANPSFDRALIFLKQSLSNGFPQDEDIQRLDTLARADGHPFYLVLTRQMDTYSNYYGLFRPGAVTALVDKLSSKSEWVKVVNDDNTVVFKFAENGGL